MAEHAFFRPARLHARFTGWIALLILLLAFAVRFHHLAAQSLWNDEGNSLRLAQRSVTGLLDAAEHDIHPPGYYLLLKLWIGAAGQSEFGLRALSALQGVLAIAAALALSRALFAHRASEWGALLVALSPFAIYYSQEARMYAQLAMLSAFSLWVLVIWLRRADRGSKRAWRWALALGLINAAGLYTQYTYAFTMLAQGLLVVVVLVGPREWRPGSPRRVLGQFVALNVLAIMVFLPWLPTAWDQVTAWPRTGTPLALAEQLRTVFTWITYGNTAGTVPWLDLLWPGVLLLAGVVLYCPPGTPGISRARWGAALLLGWGGIVIAALFASGAYRAANLKFLLPAQVAAALLIGRGAWQMWTTTIHLPRLSLREMRYIRRMIAAVCLFLLMIGQLEALDALYRDDAYARPDYRAMAARIMADPRPGDAVILDAPNQVEVFSYYYSGSAPVYELPRGLGGDDAQTRAETLDVIANHRRIFVLFWGEEERDPNRVVQATLDEYAYPIASQWVGDVRFAQYAVLGETPAAPDTRLNARFGEHMTLLGSALSANELSPGDVVGVSLFWSADVSLDARYTVTVQLLSPEGRLISQHDAEPANYRAPTTSWTPGETIIDTHGVVVPFDLAPGVYPVLVGVYDPADPLIRLPVILADGTQGDLLPVGTLAIR